MEAANEKLNHYEIKIRLNNFLTGFNTNKDIIFGECLLKIIKFLLKKIDLLKN